MEISHYNIIITHSICRCHVISIVKLISTGLPFKKNAHECVTYQNYAQSMPYKVSYTNIKGKPRGRWKSRQSAKVY